MSLLEMVVVIAIILIVAAVAVPNMLSAISNSRLHTAAANVAGILQAGRMQAVRDNRFYTLRNAVVNGTNAVFVDSVGNGAPGGGSGNGNWDQGETLVQIPTSIQFDASGANPAFPNATVGPNFVPLPPATIPSFNQRGLPCVTVGAVCQTTTAGGAPVNFLYFMRLTDNFGIRWAAISVTSAGRVRAWMYDRSANTWN